MVCGVSSETAARLVDQLGHEVGKGDALPDGLAAESTHVLVGEGGQIDRREAVGGDGCAHAAKIQTKNIDGQDKKCLAAIIFVF
jgi:hypothetical protein